MSTSVFDTTTNLWRDAFLAGRGGDLDNYDDSNNNAIFRAICDGEDARTMSTSVFDTTTNLRLDAFLAGRGGDLDNDDNSNYN